MEALDITGPVTQELAQGAQMQTSLSLSVLNDLSHLAWRTLLICTSSSQWHKWMLPITK